MYVYNNAQFPPQTRSTTRPANFVGETSPSPTVAVGNPLYPSAQPFCEQNLPLTSGPDTTVLDEKQLLGAISGSTDPFFPTRPDSCEHSNEPASLSAASNMEELTSDYPLDELLEFDMATQFDNVIDPVLTAYSGSSSATTAPSDLIVTGNAPSRLRPSNLPQATPGGELLGFTELPKSSIGRHHPSELPTPQAAFLHDGGVALQAFKERHLDSDQPDIPDPSPMDGAGMLHDGPMHTTVTASQESSFQASHSNSIGDSLDIIHLMGPRRTERPTVVFPSGTSFGAPPPTPPPALTPSPSSHYAPPPSPAPSLAPSTPATPSMVLNYLDTRSYLDGDDRVFELFVPSHVDNKRVGLSWLYKAEELCEQFKSCLRRVADCDLKVANESRALFSSFSLDDQTYRLELRLPKGCVPAGECLKTMEGRRQVDFRHRLMVLQAVVNTLATVHTLGNENQLCFHGAFLRKSNRTSAICTCDPTLPSPLSSGGT